MNYFTGTDEYVLSQELKDNVNVAIALGRPLLVKGEPGTGKTLLAHSIARGLGKRLLVWNIKSTTKAQEGLYVYDTVQRLNDARFGDKDVSNIKQYIKLFELDHIQLQFDEEALAFIVDKAVEFKLGARGLRSICENIMIDAMFHSPSQELQSLHVTREYAMEKLGSSQINRLKAG